MITFIILTTIIATALFIYLKNKMENRSIDRQNKLAEKQEALFQLLKEKNKDDEN
ncbi:MAG: hypothetical protein ACOYLO_10360 [Ferruginibacter sp.]